MPEPLFSVNAHRQNSYSAIQFRVLIDGQPVAGFRKMSALKRSTETVDFYTDGAPRHRPKLAGGTKYEAITLEQRLTNDPMLTKKRYGLVILNYAVTSNPIHLLVYEDKAQGIIPRSMQRIAGRVG